MATFDSEAPRVITRPSERVREEIKISPQSVKYPVIVYGKRYGVEASAGGLGATDFTIINSSPSLGLTETYSFDAERRRVLEPSEYSDFNNIKPDFLTSEKSEVPAIVCKFIKGTGYFFELFRSSEGRHAKNINQLARTNRPYTQIRLTILPIEDISRMHRHSAALYPGLYTGKIHPQWVPRAQRPPKSPTRLHMYGSQPIDPTLEITLPRIGELFDNRSTSLIKGGNALFIAKMYNALQYDNAIVECISTKGPYFKLLVAQTLAYLETSKPQALQKQPFAWSTDPIVDNISPRGLIFRKPHEELSGTLKGSLPYKKHIVIDENSLGGVKEEDAIIIGKLFLFQKYPFLAAHQRLMLGVVN